MRHAIAGHERQVLLLGATPELSQLGVRTLAVDASVATLTCIWPGNDDVRRSACGHWLELPCRTGTVSAVIGDGSLSWLAYPDGYGMLFRELRRVIEPGGRLAIRVFTTPDTCESLETVRASALRGEIPNVHVLKWRLAHAVGAAQGDVNVPVLDILRTFNAMFPNRSTLRDSTGWSPADIDAVDVYVGATDVYSFPTAGQLLHVAGGSFSNPRLLASGGYPFAERCPLLIAVA